MAYEWFTLDGEAFSSSSGHVIMVQDVLELIEPAVLRYFFTKDPSTARDFSVERIDQLVDEFDRFERAYFDGSGTEARSRETVEVAYPAVVGDSERPRLRLPYTFAAVLGMTDDPDLREEIARREGHIPTDASERAIAEALGRVERARAWASRTGNEFDYELKRVEMPEVTVDDDTAAALADLAEFVAAGHDGDAIQGRIFELAEEYDLDVGEFFGAGYRLFFDDTEGPKLGPFLARLDRGFVVDRLRQER